MAAHVDLTATSGPVQRRHRVRTAIARACAVATIVAGLACGDVSVLPSAGGPAIAEVSPSSGRVGASVTILGSDFDSTKNVIKFGAGYIRDIKSEDGRVLRFTVPAGLDLCAPDVTGPCPNAYPRVTPGEYKISVISNSATSNTTIFTVVGE
jgi:hypothetical protein